jgi:PIN domain nuclease of toxin-antitoxin system
MNILDTSAILALIKKEKGWENIEKLLETSEKNGESTFIHAINFIELTYKCQQLYGNKISNQIISDLQSPFLGIMNYIDTDLNLYAAHIKANYHLSLGDAIGLAYTKIMNGTFWTADKDLQEIAAKETISLKCIR